MNQPVEISTVLVANRGEIARRVFRTCREQGLRAAAIHTAADAGSLHVRDADVAAEVPSYLDGAAVVEAALALGADAVHPGYGFLSENAAFARAVTEAGLLWIGPPPAVIEQMGRKDAAREIAVAAGVPVVPSYALDDDPATLAYPVLVKAAAGGGGKGMRVVRDAAALAEAKLAAGREAAKAFGDDTLLLEKYVERGRHIEVQLVGDSHGTVAHLLTRECSVQRRHQKVLEEAPAPGLSDELRARLHAAAVALGEAVGYTNAGTVEFLLDADTDDFYFLEMNTRLQVEHPVTEEVTGLDLVALQLAVAAGKPLGLGTVTPLAHAIEARVYAEDAWHGFLPQAGTASFVAWPAGVRVDHALESGQVVGTGFDPMLGKVVAVGASREEARTRLVAALGETVILGLTTNTGFLRELTASDPFRDGTIDTAWLDRTTLERPDDARARLAAGHAAQRAVTAAAPSALVPDGWRDGGPPAPVVRHGVTIPVTGATPRGVVRLGQDRDEVVVDGERFVLEHPGADRDHTAAASASEVHAPMPGTVLDVRVAVGDSVEAGAVLGVMEAMKMELSLTAPFAGTVTEVAATTGAQVALGTLLFHVDAAESGA